MASKSDVSVLGETDLQFATELWSSAQDAIMPDLLLWGCPDNVKMASDRSVIADFIEPSRASKSSKAAVASAMDSFLGLDYCIERIAALAILTLNTRLWWPKLATNGEILIPF